MLMAKPQYLEMIGWQETMRKSHGALSDELGGSLKEGASIGDAVRLLKQREEIRIGLLFLQKRIDVVKATKGLSRTAEAILSASLKNMDKGQADMAVISFGKLGGREITFNSDIDLIFVTGSDVNLEQTKVGEKLLRMLISYTRDGTAYSVDTRLRPEGSKGPLVSSIEAFKQYYAEAAAFWEFQALLKARPVAGDMKTGCRFMEMAYEALAAHGSRVDPADIRQMRERIMRERAKESEGYDIKLGPGGIEDIEFTVQYLQLKYGKKYRKLYVQNTLAAIHRLGSSRILTEAEGRLMKDGYLFFRTLESLLRLRGEGVLKKDEGSLKSAARFMDFQNRADFTARLDHVRVGIKEISAKYLRDV
jgi:glutamate-ammonia-ligase adenylyltransferase